VPKAGFNARKLRQFWALEDRRRQMAHSAWECGFAGLFLAISGALHTREVAGSKPAAPIFGFTRMVPQSPVWRGAVVPMRGRSRDSVMQSWRGGSGRCDAAAHPRIGLCESPAQTPGDSWQSGDILIPVGAKRPWPRKAYALVAVVVLTLMAIAILSHSWLHDAALLAGPLVLIGWFAFLWFGGYHLDARERQ
jgi:hypothetical protein